MAIFVLAALRAIEVRFFVMVQALKNPPTDSTGAGVWLFVTTNCLSFALPANGDVCKSIAIILSQNGRFQSGLKFGKLFELLVNGQCKLVNVGNDRLCLVHSNCYFPAIACNGK